MKVVKSGDSYVTYAPELDTIFYSGKQYRLTAIPGNANGKITGSDVYVTYIYEEITQTPVPTPTMAPGATGGLWHKPPHAKPPHITASPVPTPTPSGIPEAIIEPAPGVSDEAPVSEPELGLITGVLENAPQTGSAGAIHFEPVFINNNMVASYSYDSENGMYIFYDADGAPIGYINAQPGAQLSAEYIADNLVLYDNAPKGNPQTGDMSGNNALPASLAFLAAIGFSVSLMSKRK